MKNPRLLSKIKNLFMPKGRSARRIMTGIFKGLVMDLDLASQAQVHAGLFEREVYKWAVELSKDINTAIDIGAAAGEYTLYFIKKTSAAKVFSFEPSEDHRMLLTKNLGLNNIKDNKIILSPKMVSSRDSDKTLTLDSLIDRVSVPCLLKIDTDGTEVDILKGAGLFLELSDVRLIIETHSKKLEEGCISLLSKAGFTTKVIPNAWWRLFIPELRPTAHNRWLVATKSPYK